MIASTRDGKSGEGAIGDGRQAGNNQDTPIIKNAPGGGARPPPPNVPPPPVIGTPAPPPPLLLAHTPSPVEEKRSGDVATSTAAPRTALVW